jgi:hypothetical protein
MLEFVGRCNGSRRRYILRHFAYLAKMIYSLPPLTDLVALDGYIDKLRENESLLRTNLTAAHILIRDQEKRLSKLSSSNPLHSIFDFRGSSIEKSMKSLAALGKGRQKMGENNSTDVEDSIDKKVKKSAAGVSRETLLKTVKLLRKKLLDSEDSSKGLQDEIIRHKERNIQAEESYSRLQATNYKLESLIFERLNYLQF